MPKTTSLHGAHDIAASQIDVGHPAIPITGRMAKGVIRPTER